jgi:hypothetical protein
MKRYEHSTVIVPRPSGKKEQQKELEAVLRGMENEGWELAGVYPLEPSSLTATEHQVLVFKRPVALSQGPDKGFEV